MHVVFKLNVSPLICGSVELRMYVCVFVCLYEYVPLWMSLCFVDVLDVCLYLDLTRFWYALAFVCVSACLCVFVCV